MLQIMAQRRTPFLGALLPLAGIALLISACSSTYSIPVTSQFEVDGVQSTNASCEVSGSKTTASGSITGPATVILELTVQNAAGKNVGTIGRATRSVPLGDRWRWTISSNTAGVTPARCTINSDGSVRSTTSP